MRHLKLVQRRFRNGFREGRHIRKELTLKVVLRMHKKIMFPTSPLIAGDLRLTEIDVRDHSGVSAEEVPAKMTEFVDWFNSHETHN
ncbi:hypothetical protein niasHT_027783 [Heterodera trifolii]|uniref:Uncharacterized protein n=1 Tax=Heterodera trifolii TaxID=157864 RepID=A0ABD2KIE1_9BILA